MSAIGRLNVPHFKGIAASKTLVNASVRERLLLEVSLDYAETLLKIRAIEHRLRIRRMQING